MRKRIKREDLTGVGVSCRDCPIVYTCKQGKLNYGPDWVPDCPRQHAQYPNAPQYQEPRPAKKQNPHPYLKLDLDQIRLMLSQGRIKPSQDAGYATVQFGDDQPAFILVCLPAQDKLAREVIVTADRSSRQFYAAHFGRPGYESGRVCEEVTLALSYAAYMIKQLGYPLNIRDDLADTLPYPLVEQLRSIAEWLTPVDDGIFMG